jgi:hypothetical protein
MHTSKWMKDAPSLLILWDGSRTRFFPRATQGLPGAAHMSRTMFPGAGARARAATIEGKLWSITWPSKPADRHAFDHPGAAHSCSAYCFDSTHMHSGPVARDFWASLWQYLSKRASAYVHASAWALVQVVCMDSHVLAVSTYHLQAARGRRGV